MLPLVQFLNQLVISHTRIVAVCAALFLALTASSQNTSELARRPAWNSSRVNGSPEPPSPYVIERVQPQLKLVEPLELVAFPGTKRLVVVEHHGKIYSFPNDKEVSTPDLFADPRQWKPELQEVYSVAFHPRFAENRFVYLWYILKPELPEGTQISRFVVTDSDPPRVDLTTEHKIIAWKSGGHNGGCIRFGKDGMLYISTGDGVGPDPPDSMNTGQDISDLLSSILRIDVDHPAAGKGYGIPPNNPFVNTPGARGEVWAYGLRNPWRMSVDMKSGDIWVADVGWELWEMVHRVQRGGNYGWSIMEGSRQAIKPDGKRGPTPILPPTYEHPHSESSSITGGYVYHGSRLPELQGSYIYGDFDNGKIWALRHDGLKVVSHRELVDTTLKIASFGEDQSGEIFIVDYNGTLQRLVPNPRTTATSNFPRRLSETGLFTSVNQQKPAPGVVSYSVNAEHWTDGAVSQRFVALPGESSVRITNESWTFPADAVLVRTLALPMNSMKPAQIPRKIETQLLHFNGDAWNAYSYRWNEQQTDADLVGAAGAEQVLSLEDSEAAGGRRQQTWRFASRTECLRCHNPWCGSALGFNALQLDRDHSHGNTPQSQFASLHTLSVLDRAPQPTASKRLSNPYGADGTLHDRARSWLHANCSHCHREHAGGSVMSFMNFDWPLERLNLVGARPMQGTFGMEGAEVAAAGDPYRSALYFRISKLGKGHMPYIGSRVIDERGTKVIHDWIKSLPANTATNQSKGTFEAIALVRENQLRQAAELKSPSSAQKAEAVIDDLLKSPSGALVLLRHVENGGISAAARAVVVAKAGAAADRQIADLFERYIPEEQRAKTLGADIQPDAILSLKADAVRGQKVFTSAQCVTCHKLAGEGREFGPDLSQIAKKYNRAQILENILRPSQTIDPKFMGYVLDETNGESVTGFIVSRSASKIVMKDVTGAEIRIAGGNVAKLTAQNLSLMPEGLLANLTAQEAADLIEFLSGLK